MLGCEVRSEKHREVLSGESNTHSSGSKPESAPTQRKSSADKKEKGSKISHDEPPVPPLSHGSFRRSGSSYEKAKNDAGERGSQIAPLSARNRASLIVASSPISIEERPLSVPLLLLLLVVVVVVVFVFGVKMASLTQDIETLLMPMMPLMVILIMCLIID